MNKIVVSFLFSLFFIACDNNKKSPSAPVPGDNAALQKPPIENVQKVTYKSATYYTGRVDFYFTDEAGAEVVIGISNFPEDKGVPYPPELLESGENMEGPPGENPNMVGKQFLLVKDSTGKLIEIRKAD